MALGRNNTRGEKEEFKGKRRRPRKGLAVIFMLVAVIFVLLILLVGFITDWMWFGDLGYTSVFWKKLLTELEIGIPTFVVITLLTRFYLRTLKNGYFRKIESHEIPNAKRMNTVSWIYALLFGAGLGGFPEITEFNTF